jgi:phosphate transport system protein
MSETRSRFHERLAELEADILAMGELAERAVSLAVQALSANEPTTAEAVVEGDDAIDERYMAVEQSILELLALQTPVASDLRLITAMLHVNQHLERIGDQAVNVAKLYQITQDLPRNGTIVQHLVEMGDISVTMTRVAMDSLRRRDLDLCLTLPTMDDPIDRLNRHMHLEVAKLVDDPRSLDWGMHMILAARALERVGDNAVDIGEQVGFLLTGEFREYVDASHPETVISDAD